MKKCTYEYEFDKFLYQNLYILTKTIGIISIE